MNEHERDVQEVIGSPSPREPFQALSRKRRRRVFRSLPDAARNRLLADLRNDELIDLVQSLDPDEAADALALVGEDRRETVLAALDEERTEALSFLLSFDPESAAGVMTLDYVTVDPDEALSAVAERVDRYEERTGRFPTVLVTDDGELLGRLPEGMLGTAESGAVGDLVEPTPTIRADTDADEVVDRLRETPDATLVVVDTDGDVIGVVDAADLIRVVDESAGETLYEFTGVAEEESVLDGPLRKVRSRYKWLIINLGTAFLAAAAVGLFEDTIQALPLLAAYMPVVAGMGGNAGTQSMAVTVRGIAYGHVSIATGGRAIGNEVIAGAINGVIVGALVAVIASIVNANPLLGGVLAVSMVLNLVIAGFFGTLIPLVLDRLGYDPATSATIFITTATDVLGFFIFLGLAQTLLLP